MNNKPPAVQMKVERILDAIPTAQRDNTIVIYTSDHGEMGMAHGGLRQKMFNIYEETVNVPLIIHNPKRFLEAQTTGRYGSLIDMMPTVASLANVPNPTEWFYYGQDLTPLLDDPAAIILLPTAHCPLPSAFCPPPTAHCPLSLLRLC